MSDLWINASTDHDAEQFDRLITTARLACVGHYAFAAAATTKDEFDDRLSLVADRVEAQVAELAGESSPAVHEALLAGWHEDFALAVTGAEYKVSPSGRPYVTSDMGQDAAKAGKPREVPMVDGEEPDGAEEWYGGYDDVTKTASKKYDKKTAADDPDEMADAWHMGYYDGITGDPEKRTWDDDTAMSPAAVSSYNDGYSTGSGDAAGMMTSGSKTAKTATEYADQRAHDVNWMTAEERDEHDKKMRETEDRLKELGASSKTAGSFEDGIARIMAETDPAVLRAIISQNNKLPYDALRSGFDSGVSGEVESRLDAQTRAAEERLKQIEGSTTYEATVIPSVSGSVVTTVIASIPTATNVVAVGPTRARFTASGKVTDTARVFHIAQADDPLIDWGPVKRKKIDDDGNEVSDPDDELIDWKAEMGRRASGLDGPVVSRNPSGYSIRFLDKLPSGKFDLSGLARAECPLCGKVIEASGYFNACSAAMGRHMGEDHHVDAPMMPKSSSKVAEFPPKKKDDDKKAPTKDDQTPPADPAAPAAVADPSVPPVDPNAPVPAVVAPVDPNAVPVADPNAAAAPPPGSAVPQAAPPTPTAPPHGDAQPGAPVAADPGSDPAQMEVGAKASMTYTMTDGKTGHVEVVFVREDKGIYSFNGPTGEFGVTNTSGSWQDADGNTFTFASTDGSSNDDDPLQAKAPDDVAPEAPAPAPAVPKDDAKPAAKPSEQKDDDPDKKKDKDNPFAKKSGARNPNFDYGDEIPFDADGTWVPNPEYASDYVLWGISDSLPQKNVPIRIEIGTLRQCEKEMSSRRGNSYWKDLCVRPYTEGRPPVIKGSGMFPINA
jgi:hypothetical protein